MNCHPEKTNTSITKNQLYLGSEKKENNVIVTNFEVNMNKSVLVFSLI